MKKPLLATMALALTLGTSAQMPDNNICPNFTGTDLDGVSHNLYNYLDQGYTVFVDVFATWCSPCWSYSNTGALDGLYNTYGPGTSYDKVMVLGVEGDGSTTMADLQGSTGATQGNWIAITDYPILDNATIANTLEISYYPTIYKICPNRVITEVGQVNQAALWASAQTCPVADTPHDAMLLPNILTPAVCAGTPIDLKVRLQNVGTNAITSASIQAKQGATVLGSTTWTGSLGTYAWQEVNVTSYSPSSTTNITYEITTSDDDAANNTATGSIAASSAVLGVNVHLELKTDNYGSETTWKLFNEAGTVVHQDPAGNYANNTVYTYDWTLNDDECYVFEIYDAYGDGMCCSYGNGYYKLSYNSNVVIQGGAAFSVDTKPFKTDLQAGIGEATLNAGLSIFPNPTNSDVTVSLPMNNGHAKVDVYNLLGDVVKSVQLSNPETIVSLSDLNSGIYYFTITAGDQTATRKVTVNK